MDAITTIIVAVIGTWIAAVGSGMVVVMWKLNISVTKLNSNMERHEERLDGHDERLKKHSHHIFGKGGKVCKVAILFALLMFLPGCQLLGLDMEQAQAEAQETSDALYILEKRIPAVEATIDQLNVLYDAAIERGDPKEVARIGQNLKKQYEDLRLSKEEEQKLSGVLEKRVEQFKSAKDTRGYMQAALGLFGGVFGTFFTGLGVVKRREKLISVTAKNIDEQFGTESLDAFKKLQTGSLDKAERNLLDRLRK
jgi:hypothetical protein